MMTFLFRSLFTNSFPLNRTFEKSILLSNRKARIGGKRLCFIASSRVIFIWYLPNISAKSFWSSRLSVAVQPSKVLGLKCSKTLLRPCAGAWCASSTTI